MAKKAKLPGIKKLAKAVINDINRKDVENKILGSFKSVKQKTVKYQFDVGQTVELTGTHPFKGHKGEIVSLDQLGGFGTRPRVRLFDMQGHEVYIMSSSDARILSGKE